jgi:hypothetical protein
LTSTEICSYFVPVNTNVLGRDVIAVNLSRTELELLVKAVEIAGQSGWPPGDVMLRVQVLRQQLEKAIGDLCVQGWRGGG